MTWTWQFEDADGNVLSGPESEAFGSQSDAETWLGQGWRELSESGVASVTLMEGDRIVYSMSLAPAAE
jgi:hypothetical protein